MAGKGKRFELSLKNDINDNTREWVKAHRPDFSGNSAGEVADVMVVWQAERYGDKPRHVVYGELKKRSGVDEGNRKVVMAGSSQGQNGLGELQELISESPSWTNTVIAVKFPNRELIVLDAEVVEHWLRREQEGWGQEWLAHDCEHNPFDEEYQQCESHGLRLTPSNNISMVKPELDNWPSSQAGMDDWEKFATEIGLEAYDFTGSDGEPVQSRNTASSDKFQED